MPISEADERTSLLPKDAPIEPSLTGSITPGSSVDGNGNGSCSKDDDQDVEEGEVEEDANPLFEGNPEMARKMHVFFPAVVIGVRASLFHLFEQ
jgi:hypothetical protein